MWLDKKPEITFSFLIPHKTSYFHSIHPLNYFRLAINFFYYSILIYRFILSHKHTKKSYQLKSSDVNPADSQKKIFQVQIYDNIIEFFGTKQPRSSRHLFYLRIELNEYLFSAGILQ